MIGIHVRFIPTARRPHLMVRLLGGTLAVLLLTLLTAPRASAQSDVLHSALHDYRAVPVVDGMVRPWGMAFLPNGDLLVTEKPGRLRVIRDGALLPDPVPGLPEVYTQGQAGLLDVEPHPDFADNRLIYLSYSKPLGGDESTTAVIRGRFENDRLNDVEEIFEAESRGRGHYGSRLAFHPDGHLFITVGDRQASPSGDLEAHPAQDPSTHHGTINRLNPDGSVPEDNPFVGEPNVLPEIYSYGHRNPQGLAIDQQTGAVWATEHGPQGGDELNLIRPGLNYGWPVIGYGVNYGPGEPIHAAVGAEGMEQPVHFWTPVIAASGLMIYTGDAFPNWQGDLFAGGMAGEELVRLEMDGQDVVREETLYNDRGRIRAVAQGPDGFIYLAIDDRGGEPTGIVRLEPVERGPVR